ncbi:MAG TPA: trypsin-like peptidase domain-containing protein [Candidatus Brocadiia bacterium]|nr:trypsin-like peptidase domain-containing protein [Candidatus Brocadiia bacterium]
MKASLWTVVAAVTLAAGAASASNLRRGPIVDVVEKTRDCVVNISAKGIVLQREPSAYRGSEDPYDRLFRDFFQPRRYRRAQVQQPLGSGVILDASGLVATNAHVIRRASNLCLSLSDGKQYEGELLAADMDADLALLRIRGGGPFKPVRMCRSEPMLGETVVALGNPFGLSNSVTSGIVSSLDRDVTVGEGDNALSFQGLIQTSALINPGNSGGPLLNMEGELMGINTAIISDAQGIGFALPVTQLRKVMARLLSTPDARTASVGLALNDTGAPSVQRVSDGGPAAKAGVEAGDVILSVDGREITDPYDFALALLARKPGEKIKIRLRRGGKEMEKDVVLGRLPTHEDEISRRIGVSVQNVTASLAETMGLPLKWGALIAGVTPGGPAEEAGLAPGDVLVQVGRYRITTVAQAARALREAKPGDEVFIAIVRQGSLAYTRIRAK